jgi:hypothetical protein
MRCSDKPRYETKRGAKRAASRARHYGRAKTRPYHCPECGHWHNTSADAEERSYHRGRKAWQA